MAAIRSPWRWLAALEELTAEATLANVRDITGYFAQQLSGLRDRHPDVIDEIRGKGLLIGQPHTNNASSWPGKATRSC